jgi:hypothetical protein
MSDSTEEIKVRLVNNSPVRSIGKCSSQIVQKKSTSTFVNNNPVRSIRKCRYQIVLKRSKSIFGHNMPVRSLTGPGRSIRGGLSVDLVSRAAGNKTSLPAQPAFFQPKVEPVLPLLQRVRFQVKPFAAAVIPVADAEPVPVYRAYHVAAVIDKPFRHDAARMRAFMREGVQLALVAREADLFAMHFLHGDNGFSRHGIIRVREAVPVVLFRHQKKYSDL